MLDDLENDNVTQVAEILQEEIDNIFNDLRNEVQTGTEDTIYRNAKLLVFAKSIKNNLQGIMAELENNNILDDFINYVKYDNTNDNFIERLYIWLYENNGTKYDLFMDRIRLLEYVIQFIKNQ